jgi:hypothetical protein
MKPIPSESSREAQELLNKAHRLLEKADELEKAKCDCGKEPCECKDCPKCGSKMKAGGSCMKMNCPSAKMQKSDDECDICGGTTQVGFVDGSQSFKVCKDCDVDGSNFNPKNWPAGVLDSMGVQKSTEAGSQPGYTTSFDSKPAGVMFMAESGGQTRNAYYTTNQYPYNGEDVANKGSTSESVNFENLGQQMNPHHDSVPRQVENGTLSKAEEALAKAKDDLAKALCEQCGGNQFTGCRFGFGPECPGLEGTTELGEGDRDDYHPSEYMRGRY